MATLNEIATVLTVLEAAYPAFQAHERTLDVYAEALSDLDGEDLRQAARVHLLTNRFFPSVYELRAGVLALRAPISASVGEAWRQVVDQVRRLSVAGEPVFADALVAAAVRELGWREICLGEAEATRREFGRVYTALQKQAAMLALLPADLRVDLREHLGASSARLLPSGEAHDQ